MRRRDPMPRRRASRSGESLTALPCFRQSFGVAFGADLRPRAAPALDWVAGKFTVRRIHGKVTADVRGGARRWDSLRSRYAGCWLLATGPGRMPDRMLPGPIGGMRVHPKLRRLAGV